LKNDGQPARLRRPASLSQYRYGEEAQAGDNRDRCRWRERVQLRDRGVEAQSNPLEDLVGEWQPSPQEQDAIGHREGADVRQDVLL
jgi:hypothetical protein